jgi:hypothetical protein
MDGQMPYLSLSAMDAVVIMKLKNEAMTGSIIGLSMGARALRRGLSDVSSAKRKQHGGRDRWFHPQKGAGWR